MNKEIAVKLISKEMIKPSSPTPPNLRIYKISVLEQLGPSYYIPLVFFYPSPHNPSLATSKFRNILKKSLSETLTRFYPLAGRLVIEENIVRCNDEGVEYSEARVKGTIMEFINNPDADAPSVLVPRKLDLTGSSSEVQVAIRVNCFDCGGIAVAVSISHKIADAATASAFLECWASIARRNQHLMDKNANIYPNFDGIANILPPIPPTSAALTVKSPERNVTRPITSMRRFVFDRSDIAALKARGTNKDDGIVPTRTQAVIALFWKCIISAISSDDTKNKNKKNKMLVLIIFQPVNLRSRMRPPLSDFSFGHIVKAAVGAWPVGTRQDDGDDDKLYQMLVKEERDSTAKVDDAYARSRDFDPEVLRVPIHAPFTEILFDGTEKRIISTGSLLSFPYYGIDFGWGNPVRVATCKLRGESIVLFSSPNGGVEAYVCLEEKTMLQFEENSELLAFCSSGTRNQVPSRVILSRI